MDQSGLAVALVSAGPLQVATVGPVRCLPCLNPTRQGYFPAVGAGVKVV